MSVFGCKITAFAKDGKYSLLGNLTTKQCSDSIKNATIFPCNPRKFVKIMQFFCFYLDNFTKVCIFAPIYIKEQLTNN